MHACCVRTMIGQFIFGGFLVVAFAFTLGSLFAPGWNQAVMNGTEIFKNGSSIGVSEPIVVNLGLFTASCSKLSANDTVDCQDFQIARDKKWWEWMIIVCMSFAVFLECFSLAWNFFVCYSCCGKVCGLVVLEITTCVIPPLISIGLITNAFAGGSEYNTRSGSTGFEGFIERTGGWGFWLAVAAAFIVCIDGYILGYVLQCAKAENKEDQAASN